MVFYIYNVCQCQVNLRWKLIFKPHFSHCSTWDPFSKDAWLHCWNDGIAISTLLSNRRQCRWSWVDFDSRLDSKTKSKSGLFRTLPILGIFLNYRKQHFHFNCICILFKMICLSHLFTLSIGLFHLAVS